MSEYETRLQRTKEDFEKWTKDHAITVLEEGAEMRRVVVQRPGTWVYGYTITTWPNYLAITGDLGSYVFTRSPDMFEFFRSSSKDASAGINPGYWSEKVCAADRHGTEEFDIGTLREGLRNRLGEAEKNEWPEGVKRYTKMLEAIESYGDMDEHNAVEALLDIEQDAYEYGRKQFTYQFLNCIRAIVLAIRLYDERKEFPPRSLQCQECNKVSTFGPGPIINSGKTLEDVHFPGCQILSSLVRSK